MKVLLAENPGPMRQRLEGLLFDLEQVDLVGRVSNLRVIHDAVQRLKPNVVIMDAHLMNDSVLKEMRSSKAISKSPTFIMLIACSASQFPQYRKKYLAAGADYVLKITDAGERLLEFLKESEEVIRMDESISGERYEW